MSRSLANPKKIVNPLSHLTIFLDCQNFLHYSIEMISEIQHFIQANPFLAGGVGVAGAGWLFSQARAIPRYLMDLIKDQFSVSLTIWSEDAAFELFNRWLCAQPASQRTRRVAITRWWDKAAQKDRYVLAPGPGMHVFWFGGRPVLVNRSINDTKSAQDDDRNTKRQQTIQLTMPGRSRERFINILKEMTTEAMPNTVAIKVWNGFEYDLVEYRAKRSLDTVYLDENLKTRIVADVQKFLKSADSYHAKGIPWRRGYFLEGPPGTGKTTLIYVIACVVDKTIYIINPNNVGSDNNLLKAFNEGRDGIVVIEDIDSVKAAQHREASDTDETKNNIVPLSRIPFAEVSEKGITLSGLLNAIDGISAVDGRLLFITSNDPDTLGPALIRRGRIDVQEHLGLAGPREALAMFRKICPEGVDELFQKEILPMLPCAQAVLQGKMLEWV